MSNIQSIKVLRNKYQITVYINLENNRFETYTKEIATGKRTFTGTHELLEKAKQIAMVNGKWQNWNAPRKESTMFVHAVRCPDCGSYTCGANCQSNHWNN